MTISSWNADWKRVSFGAGRIDPELTADEALQGFRVLRSGAGRRGPGCFGLAAPGAEDLEELRQGRQGHSASPWTSGQNGSATAAGSVVHQDRNAQSPGGGLETIDERADLFDVVADMRDQRDVRLQHGRTGSVGQGPARLDRADVLDGVVLGDLAKALEHGRRHIDGDDRAARGIECPGDRQRKSAGAGAHVEPALTRSDRASSAARTRSPVRVGSARKSERTGE